MNESAQQHHLEKDFERSFSKTSTKVSTMVGSPYWLVGSVLLVLIWIPSGFFIGFGEIWHLLINTTTTILTFLMMSLLHASQSTWERKMEHIQYMQSSILKELEKRTVATKETTNSLH